MWARTNSERTEAVPTGGLGRQLRDEEATAKRVLLVDDHNWFRECLATVCEQHTSLGETVQARSRAEARRVMDNYNSNDFALAVVDLELPDESGMELIRELRRVGIPVLALTASRNPKRLAQESQLGPSEVLTVAASSDEILDAVRRLAVG
jgi:DNA-binding NarL/FixJ family response regulator